MNRAFGPRISTRCYRDPGPVVWWRAIVGTTTMFKVIKVHARAVGHVDYPRYRIKAFPVYTSIDEGLLLLCALYFGLGTTRRRPS